MKALILKEPLQPLTFGEWPEPKPGPNEALVKVHAAALNHRDLFITQGQYAGITTPCILGSDGAGEYEGKKVVFYPALEWGDNPHFQDKRFRVLGMPDNGTFAELIALPKENIFPAPAHLDDFQSAALPLAGLTAWRCVFTRCQLKPREKVLVSGIGGGVALMALQLAVSAGAEVFVSSGTDAKIDTAINMGAKHGENYKIEGWDKRLKAAAGGFDVIIDSAAGEGFAAFPSLCNPGARIGIYGGTLGKVNGLSMQPVFWKQLSILGSTMGSPIEFQEMLNFVEYHEIIPKVDSVFNLEEAPMAFQKMAAGGQLGKLVLQT